MSSTFEGEDIHILGYFVDPEAEAFARHAPRSYERRDAGGILVRVYPPAERIHGLLPRLLDAGLRGLEVYRATRTYIGVAELEEVARSEGLLVTGGSDWHGPGGGTELGDFYVTGDEVPDFLAAGGMQGERTRSGDPCSPSSEGH